MNINKKRIINYIDVGCINNFVRPWSNNKQYLKCVLGFDPRSSAEDKKDYSKNFSEEVNVFNYKCAIFDKEGIFPFYVCHKGECSSLFKPDLQKYIYRNGKRSTNEEKNKRMEIVSITNIKCRRLDSIWEELNIDFDFIKIDTQGADLNVIKSLGKYLDNIVGIHTELNFRSFYENIYLFNYADKYLREKGFYLYRVLDKPNNYWNNFLYLKKNTEKKKQVKLMQRIYNKKIYKINTKKQVKLIQKIYKINTKKYKSIDV